MFKRILSLNVILLACVSLAFAQGRDITGTVIDADSGFPLPGVNISIQGTSTGTITAIDGTYSVRANSGDVLLFSFVGYITQEITVANQSVIDVVLDIDEVLLEEVVVIGYGTQRRADVTGSVSSIDASDANVGLITSPDQMIQGRVPGVSITQNNGEPGAGFVVRIRGGTSISASNEPLYVIDGVPIDNARTEPEGSNVSTSAPRSPLNALNPSDIESIDILKDASATAIYGSRGANGVILISTKQGTAGRVTVDYEGYVSGSTPYKKLDMLTGSEYESFVRQQITAGELEQRALDALKGANTDWQDELFQTGVSHYHNLAMSGGATNTQYRASLGYLNQEGAIISSGIERMTGRLNANHQALDGRLRLGLNLQTAFVTNDYLPFQQTAGFEGGVIHNALAFNPTFPIENADGTYYEIGPGSQSDRNPVALANQIDDMGKTTRSLGNLSAEIDLIEGLTAQINVGLDRAQSSRRSYFPKLSPVGAQYGGQAIQRNRERSSSTLQTYLTYQKTIADDHNLDLLGGYEFNEYLTEEFGTETRNFVTDYWRYNNLGGGADLIKPYSYKDKSRLVSFFTRANYNYQNKYYLTGVLRYDGSSRFGSGNKWALFPAVSGAWRISDESFMRDITAISDLRLKVGWGIVGSQEIGNYNSLALLAPDPGARAVIGGTAVTGVAPTTYANPDLKWEETMSFNVGFDYGLMSGKYSGTLEYYLKKTSNLLLQIPVPQPAVVENRLENIGEVENQGIEFSLDALAVDKTDLSVLLGVVMSAERNEVVSLGDREEIFTGRVSGRGQSGVNSQVIRPGEALGSFYGPVFDGVVNGVQTFKDLDGDGVIEDTADDREVIGVARPDFTFGFRAQAYWKQFDVSLFIRGDVGRDVFNNTALVYQTKSAVTQNNNFFSSALDDPDALKEPAKYSSRWIENASFLRVQNLTIGYTLDVQSLSSHIRNARVYVSADNLLLITGYSGFDPEVNTHAGLATLGVDYTNYPQPRTITLGVNIGF